MTQQLEWYAPRERANLQSWSVKSLLHFVVCFIVWTGEYHTLAVVAPSLVSKPLLYTIFDQCTSPVVPNIVSIRLDFS